MTNLLLKDLDAETLQELEEVAHNCGIVDPAEAATMLLRYGLDMLESHRRLNGSIRAYLDVLKVEVEDAKKATKQ